MFYPAYRIEDILKMPYLLFVAMLKYAIDKANNENRNIEKSIGQVPKWTTKK
jgi:hypothetical protein